jgi:hypothetical protein
MATERVLLPVRNIDREAVRQRIAGYESGTLLKKDLWSSCDYQWAVEFDRYCQSAAAPSSLASLVQATALGRLKLVFLPGEPLTDACAAIRKRVGDTPLVISAYANDTSVGYIPSTAAAESGGYEVEQAFKFYGLFPLACGAEAVIRDACWRMLRQLEQG